MENNRTVQVNWGTFNVPTLLSVLGILWYTATHTATQDERMAAFEKTIDPTQSKIAKIDNLDYRLTAIETRVDSNDKATNARIDRQTDALQGIRDTLGTLSANVLVINNKIDNALPIKKSELAVPPPELTRRN